MAPDSPDACAMRARVLSGDAIFHDTKWNVGPRTAAEIKEAATWYRHAAKQAYCPADALIDERNASACDAVAGPLLAEEEREAAEARVAAEAVAAEALKVAEAKATAAAEQLLDEEEKEKQAASSKPSKAKGKGKKGKGKR